MLFKTKRILDTVVPENFKHIRKGFGDPITKYKKQLLQIAFTNIFLMSSSNLKKWQSFAKSLNLLSWVLQKFP